MELVLKLPIRTAMVQCLGKGGTRYNFLSNGRRRSGDLWDLACVVSFAYHVLTTAAEDRLPFFNWQTPTCAECRPKIPISTCCSKRDFKFDGNCQNWCSINHRK